MRAISPRVIVRINRRDITGQIRNRAPPTLLIAPLVPPVHGAIIVHVYDGGSRALPSVALAKLHVVILAPCSGRLVRAAPVGHFAGADRDEGSEFARAGAAAVAAEGELAGDFGNEVAEEVGHGDEAAADDAGCDLGDAILLHGQLVEWMQRAQGCQAHVHNATGNR